MTKDRITQFVLTRGTEKRKLLVIDESQSPRCFMNVKQLPVTFHVNKTAWMRSQIFEN